jgi:uncharacterized protein DUF4288
MTAKEPWYGAKCLFLHKDLTKSQRTPCYEERITLIRARSFTEAVRKGETEAKRYAKGTGRVEYLGFISVFHLFDSKVGDGTEVFSIMRSISLSKKAFIDRHYDDGTFHSREAP